MHYTKLTQPFGIGEWLPSALVVIGRYFPERSIFQIFAALASWFHIGIVVIWYFITKTPNSKVPELVFASGLVRTVFLAGIIYIPSQDDHDTHDKCFAGYLLMTGIWFYGLLTFTGGTQDGAQQMKGENVDQSASEIADSEADMSILPRHEQTIKSREKPSSKLGHEQNEEDKEDSSKRYRKPHATEGYKLRKQIAITYALLFIPLGHYMMQTRVYGLSGAVSKYAIFEWLAIILDIAFDGVAMKEFNGLELKVLAYPYPSHYNGSLGDEKDENLDEDKTVSSSQKEHMERYFA